MASQREMAQSTWKAIAKRELAQRVRLRWSLASFLDDRKCPKIVKQWVMKKYVAEILDAEEAP